MNEKIVDALHIRKRILENYFEVHDTPITLAANQQANNKLDLAPIEHDQSLRGLIIPALGDLVLQHEPEFVIGVPTGGTWLADAVANEINCYSAHLKRDEQRNMSYEDQEVDWGMTVSSLSRGVLVEDVFNRFTSTRQALAVPGLNERVVAIIGIWDRGVGHTDRQAPAQPHQALITDHIDEMMLPLGSGQR
jgi:orotate phosphoribosyltransferase